MLAHVYHVFGLRASDNLYRILPGGARTTTAITSAEDDELCAMFGAFDAQVLNSVTVYDRFARGVSPSHVGYGLVVVLLSHKRE